MTQYLTVEEIIIMNVALMKQTSPNEQVGVKDIGLLKSADARPQATFDGADLYPTFFLKAAALMQSLAQNHSFHNANKRTAFSATVVFLKLNGYNLKLSHDDAVQYALDVTNGVIDVERSSVILQAHSKPRIQQSLP
jgi:death-on-curing protein